jgi:transcriptional regulator with XRE-family HTH domain
MQENYKQKRAELSEALGRVISKLRKAGKHSARSIAYEIELSKSTILLAEQGKLDPQISTFYRLAEAFYIKPDELMKLVQQELPENWNFLND